MHFDAYLSTDSGEPEQRLGSLWRLNEDEFIAFRIDEFIVDYETELKRQAEKRRIYILVSAEEGSVEELDAPTLLAHCWNVCGSGSC
jgi:hypothetical protein